MKTVLLKLICLAGVGGFALPLSLHAAPKVNMNEKASAAQTASLSRPVGEAVSPVKMFIKEGDSIEVKGYRGSLEYVAIENAKDVSVMMQPPSGKMKHQEDWQFSFKREGSVVSIAIEGPSSKQIWSEILASGQIPEYNLKIVGPSLPLHINWNEGRITVIKLKNELHVTALKADVIVTKGEGDITVANQEGSVRVREQKGEVKVDCYLARVEIADIEGRLDLVNFTGESQVQNINGNMMISSYKGVTKVADVKGRLEFKNGNSPFHIEKFEGELRGHTEQGAVYADVRGDADVRLESVDGAVNLKLPASGAWVNLGTEDGSLAVPSFLKLTRLQTQQIRTGRLKGATGGSVFVRTESGDIRLK